MESIVFGSSSKKRPIIVFKGNTFNLYRKNKKQIAFWRCAWYQKAMCRSQLVTDGDKILNQSTFHHTHSIPKCSDSHTVDDEEKQSSPSISKKLTEEDLKQLNQYFCVRSNSQGDANTSRDSVKKRGSRSFKTDDDRQCLQRLLETINSLEQTDDNSSGCSNGSTYKYNDNPVASKHSLREEKIPHSKPRKNVKATTRNTKRQVKWFDY